ncbi:hypothetical protein ES288_A07G259000v1 [Gossypium darwinii]|uniref:Uncharacterized protein n=1 Tax=Gossypium darwinii TaxID=34276 RepID=A0A5D2G2V3_GOSDA|nr:hypothetical protein ES288_A07G259000v1 [Gossypium darwinii]
MVKCSLEQLKKAKTMATIAAWQSSKTALSLSSNSSLGQRLPIPPPLSPLHFIEGYIEMGVSHFSLFCLGFLLTKSKATCFILLVFKGPNFLRFMK